VPVAWFASHRHTSKGANEACSCSYLFAYEPDLPINAKTITPPNNGKIRVLAITVSDDGAHAYPAQPVYDTLDRTLEK
jgi:alpha-mannosidase